MLWSYVLDPNLIYALLDPKSHKTCSSVGYDGRHDRTGLARDWRDLRVAIRAICWQ